MHSIPVPFNANRSHTSDLGLIYHVFPLGLHGSNDPNRATENIRAFIDWIPWLSDIGVDTVLFGPVFSSMSHGYDVIDLFEIDPRLGSTQDFAAVCEALHAAGFAVMLDAVLNHVGRRFFAFTDIQAQREASSYREWVSGLSFGTDGPAGDGFHYDTWDGHAELVKLNHANREVREYLFSAVRFWIETFRIDGLRLDAADVIPDFFHPELRAVVEECYRPFRRHFSLIGEMVHGDYNRLLGPDRLDGVTNYECYKGLYSAHNDRNYHEIAHSLERQFSETGVYRVALDDGRMFATFVDNHDVDRIADVLADPVHIYPLHILLFTIPGVPIVYYGSETGIAGRKGSDDWPLRPALTPEEIGRRGSHPDLAGVIARLSSLRRSAGALREGAFRGLEVRDAQFVFERRTETERVVVVVNADHQPAAVAPCGGRSAFDLLNNEPVDPNREIEISPTWGRVLRVE